MNMQAEKIQLMKMLLETEDLTLIRQIRQLIKSHTEKTDIWDKWDDEVRADVEEAIKQADRGELIPHDKAVTLLKKWA
jgi:hypothetical protein